MKNHSEAKLIMAWFWNENNKSSPKLNSYKKTVYIYISPSFKTLFCSIKNIGDACLFVGDWHGQVKSKLV